jgi:serine/threonine protein kinase
MPAVIKQNIGPYISFAGAVWNGRPNIQILTTGIPLHFHPTDIKLQKTTARCIGAFVSAVQSLKAHYNEPLYHQTQMVNNVNSSVRNIFPYPVTFTSDTSGLLKKFIYHSLVKSRKLIFRGEISDTHEKICIKFVHCYSVEVHKFCTSINCAPRLLGFESLGGGWHMVVMEDLSAGDYFDLFGSSLAPDRVAAIKERLDQVLVQMHQQGLVHGDLRDANVMVTNDPTPAVMLVDFDWAGRIGEARYPINVNRGDVYRPEGAVDNELILAEHDMWMLTQLILL